VEPLILLGFFWTVLDSLIGVKNQPGLVIIGFNNNLTSFPEKVFPMPEVLPHKEFWSSYNNRNILRRMETLAEILKDKK
jgi:hypothetical protein